MKSNRFQLILIFTAIMFFTLACVLIPTSSSTDSQILEDGYVTQPPNADLPSESPAVVQEMSADYLFKDNFDEGIRTDWFVTDGEWRMVNGRLQAISGYPARIRVGDETWHNYTVEARIGGLQNTVSSAMQFLENDPNIIFFGVNQSEKAASGYWFGLSNWKQQCSLDINFEENIVFSSVESSLDEEAHTIRLEVISPLYKFFIDGEQVCSFSDSELQNGYFFISVFPGSGTNPSYPWIDEIFIKEN